MSAVHAYSYCVVRLVPRMERGESLNVGILLHCRTLKCLEVEMDVQPARWRAVWPDVDVALVESHLAAWTRIAHGSPDGGPMARLPAQERFHWLAATRSTMLQSSPLHTGVCTSSSGLLQHLMDGMVRVKAGTPG